MNNYLRMPLYKKVRKGMTVIKAVQSIRNTLIKPLKNRSTHRIQSLE